MLRGEKKKGKERQATLSLTNNNVQILPTSTKITNLIYTKTNKFKKLLHSAHIDDRLTLPLGRYWRI